jgi:hypothetical protein
VPCAEPLLQVPARSETSARAGREMGAEPVAGDLSVPGVGRDHVAAADRVVHAAQPSTFGARPTRRAGGRYEADRRAVRRRIDAGMDAVIAFPGAVYGDGAWLGQYTLAPLRAGKPVGELAGRSRTTSPVAVTDVGRAVAFLACTGRKFGRWL